MGAIWPAGQATVVCTQAAEPTAPMPLVVPKGQDLQGSRELPSL
jgi:hypothetical protein